MTTEEAEKSYTQLKKTYEEQLDFIGLRCITCNGKKAAFKGWRDEEKWRRPVWLPSQNLGVLTGKTNGITVIDIDLKDDGMKVWEQITKKNSPGDPWIIHTGKGGLHLYYEYDPEIKLGDHKVRCDGKMIGWDIRNDGGYVISPDSVHPETGRCYEMTQTLTEYISGAVDIKRPWEIIPRWLKDLYLGRTEIINGEIVTWNSGGFKVPPAPSSSTVESESKAAIDDFFDRPVLPKEQPEYKYVDEKFIHALIDLLDLKRADYYEMWSKTLWALKNCEGIPKKWDFRELAHTFSKRTRRNNYFVDDTNLCYDRAKEKLKDDDKLLGIASLRKWAAEDNPRGYDKLCNQAIDDKREPAKVGYYDDVVELTSGSPTVEEVEEWMRSCLYKIMDGGNSYWMARKPSGGWKRLDTPFRLSENYSVTTKSEVKTKESTKVKTTSTSYWEILLGLQTKPSFKPNIFSELEFRPMVGDPRHNGRKFNSFPGFLVKPQECKDDDVYLKLVLDHFREVIANNNEPYYEYMMNWFAHCFQRPNMKIGTMLIWIGPQEGGKNILIDWIGKEIYGPLYVAPNSRQTIHTTQ